MNDDSDDFFEEIIEVDFVTESDDSNHSDKENEKFVKRPKAKKNQMIKLKAFMAENSESSIEKDKFKDRWRNLICELNDLGPPTFTDSEWKLKWAQHKYNKKRPLAIKNDGPSRQDQPSLDPVAKPAVVTKPVAVTKPVESTHETEHSVMLNKIDAILEKLDKTNFLLEKIAHSLDK